MSRLKKTPILAVCLVLALSFVFVLWAANTKGVSTIAVKKGLSIGAPGLQLTTNSADPTDNKIATGDFCRLSVKANVLRFHDGTSWANVATGANGTADAVYNSGAWTVDVDANDVIFRVTSTSYNLLLDTNVTGTSAELLVLDAKHTDATVTDALLFTTSGGSAVITDAIDASDAGIVNALTTGANDLSGSNWSITGSTGAAVFVGVTSGSGDVNVGSSKLIIAGATGKITGTSAADIDLNSVFTVDATQGDTVVAGTLTVNGDQIIGDGSTEIIGFNQDVVADIDNEAITIAQSGTIWTNASDGDGTVFTLPEASTAIGCRYTFVVLAAQNLNINPFDATDRFVSPITNAAGDSIQSATIGDSVTVLCVGADTWVIEAAYPAASDWIDSN